jgi:hypothetical protein
VQPKLVVNEPGDRYEREADAVADRAVRSAVSTGGVTSRPYTGAALQRVDATADGAGEAPAPVHKALREPGVPLDPAVRSHMETRLGYGFKDVRIHSGGSAVAATRAVRARAFTVGTDIVFGAGEYAPGSRRGRWLLAHELTHVAQQRGSAGLRLQRANLSSPRLAGNPLFEDVRDNNAVIEAGDTGPEVRRLQQLLIDLGFALPTHGASGTFNTETEKAVKAFQRSGPDVLTDDGRVGFRTIAKFDRAFPTVALPPNRGAPWTMSCVLDILCPWNRHLVENVLPTFDIVTFDSREFPVETWTGSKWKKSTFKSGGFRSGSRMGFKNTTCERFALVIYHEGWHGLQASSLTGVVDVEKDAYTATEQWSIGMGIPGQTFEDKVTKKRRDLRKTSKSGETVVDESAAEALVKQKYGGVSSVPGERVLHRVVGTVSDVRVRRPNGSEYERPAAKGESVRGKVVMKNLKPIDKKKWKC